MTGTSQDTTLIDLFTPLEGGIGLDAPDTQVITDSGIQKVQEDRRTHDRLAAIEAFTGWADALDPESQAVRERVLNLIEP